MDTQFYIDRITGYVIYIVRSLSLSRKINHIKNTIICQTTVQPSFEIFNANK